MTSGDGEAKRLGEKLLLEVEVEGLGSVRKDTMKLCNND